MSFSKQSLRTHQANQLLNKVPDYLDQKGPLRSLTIWQGIAYLSLSRFEWFQGVVRENPGDAFVVVGVLSILIRLITKKAISLWRLW